MSSLAPSLAAVDKPIRVGEWSQTARMLVLRKLGAGLNPECRTLQSGTTYQPW